MGDIDGHFHVEVTDSSSGPAERPNWDDTFMAVAELMARRSTCLRAKTGAVLATSRHQILTTGYNGAPSKLPHCTEVGCLLIDDHCLRTVHSEMNAIAHAARLGIKIAGSTLYATHRPCIRCIPMILQVGIERIMYKTVYNTDGQLDGVARMCEAANVELIRLNVPPERD